MILEIFSTSNKCINFKYIVMELATKRMKLLHNEKVMSKLDEKFYECSFLFETRMDFGVKLT